MTLNVGDIVPLKVYGELCCEECMETIHNHIDCPVCNVPRAETENYERLEKDTIVECGCGSKYELAPGSNSWYVDCKARLIYIPETILIAK